MQNTCYWIVFSIVIGLAVPAQASELATSLRRSNKQTVKALKTDPEATARESVVPKAISTVTIGLAHGREVDENGATRIWTTPFSYDYTTGDKRWSYEISGDGYTRASAPDETRTGFADGLALITHRRFPQSNWAIEGAFGFTLPARNEAGSMQASREARLSATYAPRPWSWNLGAVVAHKNYVTDQVSQFTQSVNAQAKLEGSDQSVAMQLTRTYTRGEAGTAEITLEYERSLSANVSAAFSGTRGHAGPKRSTTFEFRVGYEF